MPSLRADSIADMPLTTATERLTAATRRSVLPYLTVVVFTFFLGKKVFTCLLLRVSKKTIDLITGVLTSKLGDRSTFFS